MADENVTKTPQQATAVDIEHTKPNNVIALHLPQKTPSGEEILSKIADEVKRTGKPHIETVRTLLSWFGYRRRGALCLYLIDTALSDAGLKTEPYFDTVWLDSEVALVLVPKTTLEALFAEQARDPTYRLSRLRAANNPPLSVSPQGTIREAVTMMMANDFSQLPVMSGERTCKGAISLMSVAKRWALGAKCELVQDCLEQAQI